MIREGTILGEAVEGIAISSGDALEECVAIVHNPRHQECLHYFR